jgi:hypothetical protein
MAWSDAARRAAAEARRRNALLTQRPMIGDAERISRVEMARRLRMARATTKRHLRLGGPLRGRISATVWNSGAVSRARMRGSRGGPVIAYTFKK